MLDGVDGAGEFFDGAGERCGEVVDDDTWRGDLAGGPLIGLERGLAAHVAQHPHQPNGGAGLQVPVVLCCAQPVEELVGVHPHTRLHCAQHVVAVGELRQCCLDDLTGLA